MRFWTAVLGGIGLLAALSAASGGAAPSAQASTANAQQVPDTRAWTAPTPQVSASLHSSSSVTPATADQDVVMLRMRIGTFDPLAQTPSVPQSLQRQIKTQTASLSLVQFPGVIQDEWVQAIQDTGLDIVTYMPDYAYLVWGTQDALAELSQAVPTRWQGTYEPAYAIHPEIAARLSTSSPLTVTIQLFSHSTSDAALQVIQDQATKVTRPAVTLRGLTNLVVEIDPAKLTALAQLPEIISIEPAITPVLLDEVQGQILAGNLTPDGSGPGGPGYLAWLTATVGFTTTSSAYPIVDITDDGIDDGDAVPQHPDFYTAGDPAQPDRLIYNVNWTSDATADGVGGHGNLNAAIVGGYNARTGFPYEDDNGYNYGLGINPFGPVAGSKIFRNSGPWDAPSYVEIVSRSYDAGARIISNSWGDTPGTGGYLVDDQTYDALVRDADPSTAGEQPVTIIFAAGNSGASSNTIGSPANAKNVITVGASENYRPTWTDGCGIGGSSANNAHDIASFSSRGPTDDGRVKPDLVAPGTHVQGAAAQTVDYSGAYVCDAYHPSDQTLYAASSGTSHATPGVAGAASLLTYFYETQHSDTPPSPAMQKAYLINSTRYLEGVDSGDTLPSNSQGFGSVDLGKAFDTTPRILQDQTRTFHTTGESAVLRGVVAQSSKPFRVTLAWTDAPGPTTGAAYVNDLNIAVEVNGQRYLGNVFSGPDSTPGGSPDPCNNVESVFLPTGIQGTFTITVTAANLAGDGVPDDADATDQDYALVCYNCWEEPTFELNIAPEAQSLCRPATGVYTITTATPSGFSDTVTLSVSGLPLNTLSSLAPNPITAEQLSRLTVTATTETAAGSYTIEVAGVSLTHTQTVTAALNILTAPQTPATLISPTDGITDVSTTPTLTWTPSPEMTTYRVEVSEDATFSPPVYTATTAATSHTVTQRLNHNATYYWRVIGANGCGESAPSLIRSLTIGPALSIEITPDQQHVCQDTEAHYTVSTSSADAGSQLMLSVSGVPSYTTSAFAPNPIVTGQDSQLTITPTLSSPPGTYTLHVTGVTPTHTRSTTATLGILTVPQTAPNPISPADAATDVEATPTLTWTPSSNTTHYTVQIATNGDASAFGSPTYRVYTATTAATSHTVAQILAPGTTYYWRVIGENACGAGSPSAIHSFTVQAAASLSVVPAAISICQNRTALYTVALPADTEMDGAVTLTVYETPTDTTTVCTPNPITAGQESQLAITPTAQTPPGNYTIRIIGTSEARRAETTAELDVLSVPQGSTRLLNPDDSMSDIAIFPTLSWEAQQSASQYTIEIATDAAFSSSTYIATTLTNNHTLERPLAYATTYFWRVTSANICGSGPSSVIRSFTTLPYRIHLPLFFFQSDCCH